MIASPSSGYYEVTYTSEVSGSTTTTSLGTVYVTIHVDSSALAAGLESAESRLEELYDPESKQAEKPRVDRPAPRPVTIFRPKGSRRPKPTQLPSTFG